MSDLENIGPVPLGLGTPAAAPGPAAAGAPGQRQTLACLFATRTAAEKAADDLVAGGIDRSAIEIIDQESPQTPDVAAQTEGLWENLKRLFLGEEETAGYYEGVNRGQSLLSVHVTDAEQSDRAAAILERHDPIDLDAQEAGWRQAGWTGGMGGTGGPVDVAPVGIGYPDVPAKPPARTAATYEPALAGRAAEPTSATGREEVIPVVEESLAIGKRAVAGGRVRVHVQVVENPVTQDVQLREERVQVERRRVDRPVEGSDPAFQERTVEMTETREEAVVGKTARVTEEVVVRKDAGERTERVQETVRRTEVKVDKDDAAAASLPAASRTP